MSKPTGSYPLLTVDTTGKPVVSQAGAVLLVATAGKVGLDRALSAALVLTVAEGADGSVVADACLRG